jgi:hypothetical protein
MVAYGPENAVPTRGVQFDPRIYGSLVSTGKSTLYRAHMSHMDTPRKFRSNVLNALQRTVCRSPICCPKCDPKLMRSDRRVSLVNHVPENAAVQLMPKAYWIIPRRTGASHYMYQPRPVSTPTRTSYRVTCSHAKRDIRYEKAAIAFTIIDSGPHNIMMGSGFTAL